MKKLTIIPNSVKKIKTNLLIISAFVLIVSSLSSCQKYPDGPMLSLRTRTERVANDWKISQALENGKDVTSDYTKYELGLSHNGSASLTATYKLFEMSYEFTTSGTWSFVDSDKKISFVFDKSSANGVYEILKLKEVEMWLKSDDGKVELHFVPR